ncbi:MAG: hypothetical protein E3J64_08180 [Anaerolineales bacterium]|nr:MAG: hypothetical protein E3J64_08180 [Anaerolineales bacterium]
MPLFYPSFDALRVADAVLDEIGKQTAGYQGRIGSAWFWRLPAGILASAWLDSTVTAERWDVLRAEASTPLAGIFSRADFPFAAYATSATSPPFIHDLQGVAEWSNRLYFQMGQLIDQAVRWLAMLHAAAISPSISPPAAFAALNPMERRLVEFSLEKLGGGFEIKALHEAFSADISQSRLRRLAQAWEARGLLTSVPRRVTYALRVLVEDEEAVLGEG